MASEFKVKITNIKKIITGDTQEKYQITFKGDFLIFSTIKIVMEVQEDPTELLGLLFGDASNSLETYIKEEFEIEFKRLQTQLNDFEVSDNDRRKE